MRLLEGEKILMELKPHVLAFMRYIIISLYFMVIGALFNHILSVVSQMLGVQASANLALAIWWGVLLAMPIVVGILHITFWPLVGACLLGAVGTCLRLIAGLPVKSLGPLTVAGGVVGLFLIELHRRGHEYYVTDQRLIMLKKFILKDERSVRYTDITDVVVQKGLLGRIFNFGNVIPITASGLGLGQDAAGAVVGKRIKRFGLEIAIGGARTVTVPRGRTGLQLFGIPRPEEVRDKIEELRAAWEETPYLRRIATTVEEIHKMLGRGKRA